jgi:hypothetical protein
MSNVIVIRKHRRKKSFFSFLRRRVHTAVRTDPWCFPCDAGAHHPGRAVRGCHCRCGSR